jgi:Flp pilus assembly protein TadD
LLPAIVVIGVAVELATLSIDADATCAASWLCRARARLGTREVDGAIEDVGRAIALAPKDARAWCASALARADRDHGQATRHANVAIELAPHSAASRRTRALVRSRSCTDGVVDDLSRAIALDSQDAEAIRLRGLTLRSLGDLDGAAFDFRRLLALRPDDREILDLLPEIERARAPSTR